MKYYLLLLTLVLSSSIFADVTPSPIHTISKLKVDNRTQPPRVEIYVNESVLNPGNTCPSSARYSFSYEQGGEVLFSMLLAAKMGNTPVEFFIESCFDNNPQVKIIQLP